MVASMKPRSGAPIDAAVLRDALAPFGASRTLPAEAYTSDDLFEWELDRLFEESWICVGRAENVATAGDQLAARAGRESILLTRARSGRLRAFFNVCRHRGHELLEPGARAGGRAVRCPYHGWTYRLDGSLARAPGFAGSGELELSEHSLVPARIAESQGWAFVNASGDAPSFAEHAGDLLELVQEHEPERLATAARRRYEVEANWKLIVENYHECYHCPSLHPQLCRVSPPNSALNVRGRGAWIGGEMRLAPGAQTMSMTGTSGATPIPGLKESTRREVRYFGLLPNLLLSLHPDYVMTHRIEPVAAAGSAVECEWLFAPETVSRPGFDPSYAVDFWDLTNQQDWRACEAVQRGVSSRAYRPGPLSPREDAVYEFVTFVARSYLRGRFPYPALPGDAPGAPAASGQEQEERRSEA